MAVVRRHGTVHGRTHGWKLADALCEGGKVLAVCAAGACVCMAAVILLPGGAGWYFLLLCFYVNRLCFLLFFLIFAPRWHTNQTGFFLSDYVDCRRSSGSLVNGAHSRPYFHGSGIYRTAGLLYGNLGIRSKIQKTIVIVLSHYRTQATDYLLLNNRTLI